MTTPAVPDGGPAPSGRRAELLEQLALAGRASSVATVMFHTAVAARQGLNATEEKALDLLERSGPLTAGSWPARPGSPRRRSPAWSPGWSARASPGGSPTPTTGAAS